MDTVNINNTKKGPTKVLKPEKTKSVVINANNKENLIPIEEKSNDAKSELESSVVEQLTLINSNQHIKLKKKPSKLNLTKKPMSTPFTPDSKYSESRDFEPMSVPSEIRKSLNRNRSVSDPKLNKQKMKVRPVKMEKQISATELFRSIPVNRVLKRRKTVNTDLSKYSKSISFFQVKMDFTLEEIKNLPNLSSNSVSTSLYYYYTWQVDHLTGNSGFYHLEDSHLKWKREVFSIDVIFSGCLEKKYFSPKILKLFFKQHLGSFNVHGTPIVSDCDMTVADYCLNLAPFVSTIPEDPVYESVRLNQKAHSYYDLTPALQFEVRSKRLPISSKDATMINNDINKNSEAESSEVKSKKLIRQGSKNSLFNLARSKTEIMIPDNMSASMENYDAPKSHRPSSSSQYTRQLEDKIRVLEMKISQAVQQTHTTNNMYEDLLREIEKPSKLNTSGISNLFPLDPTEQTEVLYDTTINNKQQQLTSSADIEDSYRSLMKDYQKVLEQKESVTRNFSKLAEENRQLKLQNQGLNDQLLTVLNDHYRLLSLQFSENSAFNNNTAQALLESSTGLDLLQSKPKDKPPTHPKPVASKPAVKELVINVPGTQSVALNNGHKVPLYNREYSNLEKINSVGEISDTSTSWIL